MQNIARDAYLNRIISRKGNGLVKIITGARRCGKSFLLFNLFWRHLLDEGVPEDHIIRIAFDDRANKALREPDACYAHVRSLMQDNDTYYILLDEVQYMNEFEDVLNGFLHFGNADVYVTGSNSRFLSSDIITEFRGRGDEIRVHPLSFSEYYAAVGGDWQEAWNQYSTFGGMPLILSRKTLEEKTTYLKNLVAQTYVRDIVERNNITNEAGLDELIDIVASSIGSLTNPTRLANTFASVAKNGVSQPTVSAYLKNLEEAFVITEAKRYDIKGRKYIGAQRKYYFEDIGVRNARLNFRQQEENHIMENVLFNELRCRGCNVDVGILDINETVGGRSVRKRIEIDFVANQGGQRYYIQSAFALPDEAKRAQEVRPLQSVGDSFKKIIVVKDNIMLHRDESGITTMGLKEFLLNPNSLDL